MSTFRDPDVALASWIGGGDVSSEEAGHFIALLFDKVVDMLDHYQ